jgi:hypothetical protein
MRTCIFLAAAALIAPPVLAEWGERHSVSYRRAEYRDTARDRGKCTVEVEVDGAAEIEIRGDTARLRTIGGQPASWRRFQCNASLPADPVEFRFRGIDGRGRQVLLREPWGARGAVILIEDPKRGREGHTFDIEWRGARRRS